MEQDFLQKDRAQGKQLSPSDSVHRFGHESYPKPQQHPVTWVALNILLCSQHELQEYP